jgi:hypothetical protein
MKFEQDDITYQGIVTFSRAIRQIVGTIVGTTANFDGPSTLFICRNSGATTLTSIKGISDYVTYRILGDGNTTIPNNTLIKTNTGANKLLAANKIYRFTSYQNVLYEDA